MFDVSLPIAQAIQLAVAPVFLLTGMAAMLGVLTARLGRIVDRGRVLGGLRGDDTALERRELARRARLVHRAIALCTLAAILVGLVVAVIFTGFVLAVNTSRMVALLFILATLVFILGLLFFLWEIRLTTYGGAFGIGLERSRPDQTMPS